MNILVLGRTGQLATGLRQAVGAASDVHLRFAGRDEADLAVEAAAARLIASERPDLIVNAAAYTAVDRAESEPELADRINGSAPGEAAAAAAAIGAGFIHVSTDYVFGQGEALRPRLEQDPVAPDSAYGRSKLLGEQNVRTAHPQALIVRTAWVYGPWGSNFVRTMLRLARDRDELRVVADQHGCPTHAGDLAETILALARRWPEPAGLTLHAAGGDEANWAEFADGIFAASAAVGGPVARVVPITTEEFGAPASRPRNSRLDCVLMRARFGLELPGWRSRIGPLVEDLLENGSRAA